MNFEVLEPRAKAGSWLSALSVLLSCKKASDGKGAALCLLQILASRPGYHFSPQGPPNGHIARPGFLEDSVLRVIRNTFWTPAT